MAGEQTATFAIDLKVSGAADAAKGADALKELQAAINADVGALREMQKAYRNLKGGAGVAKETINELKDRITAQKAAIATAQGKFIALGGTFRAIKPPTPAFSEFAAQVGKAPGPLGELARKGSQLSAALGGVRLATLGVVAAMVSMVAVGAMATKGLLSYGIAQANARRDEILRLEGLTKIRNRWGVVGGSATFLQEQIDAVSSSVALGRGELEGYAATLHKAGMRGGNFQAALKAIGQAASVQGKEQAEVVMGMAIGHALMGQSVKAFAQRIDASIGGIAKRQMLSLSVQTVKLKENLGRLFAGIKIDAFLEALHEVVQLFSLSTESGKALKVLLELMFSPFENAAKMLAPIVKDLFRGAIIGALELAVVLLKVRNWFRDTFLGGKKDIEEAFDAVKFGRDTLITLAAIFGLVSIKVGLLVAGPLLAFVWSLVTGFLSLASASLVAFAPFWAGAAAIAALVAVGYQLGKLFTEIDWSALGTSIVEGLVGGLKSAGTMLINSVKSLAFGARDAFKSALGIASPSKVFASFGYNTADGLSMGMGKGEAKVARSAQQMGDAVAIGGSRSLNYSASDLLGGIAPNIKSTTLASEKPAARAREPQASTLNRPANKSRSASIVIQQLTVNGDNAKKLAADIRAEIERTLEQLAIEMGPPMPFDPHSINFDYALIAGQRTPGLLRIKDADEPRKWQEIGGYGLSGAIARFYGLAIAKPVLSLFLYTQQDWDDWHRFKPIVALPPRGKLPRSLECWHPILEDAGINAINIENVKQPVETDPHVYRIDIHAWQYVKLKPQLVKPDEPKATPLDATDQRIQELAATVSRLAG